MKRAAASFVPFEPFEPSPDPDAAPTPTPGPRLQVVPKPQPDPKSGFTPVEESSGATPQTHAPARSPHLHHTAPAPAPIVTLQRDGDRVTTIRIECSCGQVLELDCSY